VKTTPVTGDITHIKQQIRDKFGST